MQTTALIRQSVAQVQALRESQSLTPARLDAVLAIKTFQSRRFANSYSDVLSDPRYASAARFFLTELYSPRDFSKRDTQFARIAGALERLFPQSVVDTATALARVHALTERLDDAMAQAWLGEGPADNAAADVPTAAAYWRCWQVVGQRPARAEQLQTVLDLGHQLDRLTHTRGLRTVLKMMRGPATTAGLSELQSFLEAGFDTFAAIEDASGFLNAIGQREGALIRAMFEDPLEACLAALQTA
jgi:hypothetical protein